MTHNFMFHDFVFISAKITLSIIAGGFDGKSKYLSSVEVLSGNLRNNVLPNLPSEIRGSSMVMHDKSILICGGSNNFTKCLQLDQDSWIEHSTLNKKRDYSLAVTTRSTTFIFGGESNPNTYEFLPKDSTEWQMGLKEIPGVGFSHGCAMAVKSEQEIWLIGGCGIYERIVSFHVNDHTFVELPSKLIEPRYEHRCAYIPNTNKILVTGGNYQDSTEIIDTEDGSVTMASPMNLKRSDHGIGVITINGEDKLAVFGGYSRGRFLNSIELYDAETGQWEISDLKLNQARHGFGFLNVKLDELIDFDNHS